MDLLEPLEIICPYCGEPVVIEWDTSAGNGEVIEDCTVCCRPMRVEVRCAPGEVFSVTALRA